MADIHESTADQKEEQYVESDSKTSSDGRNSSGIYPGHSCEVCGLSEECLLRGDIKRLPLLTLLTNGLVLELNRFHARKKLSKTVLTDWVVSLIPDDYWNQEMDGSSFKDSLRKTIDSLHKLRQKKNSRKLCDEIKALEKTCFKLPVISVSVSELPAASESESNPTESVSDPDEFKVPLPAISVSSATVDKPLFVTVGVNTDSSCNNSHPSTSSRHTVSSNEKRELLFSSNFLEHEIHQKKSKLTDLNCQIEQKKAEYASLVEKLRAVERYYSKKNVDQRDAYAKKTMKKLRKDLVAARTEANKFRADIAYVEKMKTDLKTSKLRVKKLKSKYRCRLRNSSTSATARPPVTIAPPKSSQQNSHVHLHALENEILELKERLGDCDIGEKTQYLETKEGGKRTGAFTDNVFLCTVNLLSLEVAAGKVSKVIKAVAEHLFETKLGELPCLQSAIHMADSGHYLCKRYIAKELLEGHWGINKDGTTRRKQKIMDTSFTLPSGEVMASSFRRIAHEDSATTAQLVQEELHELAEIHSQSGEISSNDYLQESLQNLVFMMNDRAATEKAANRKFLEWREETLENQNVPEVHGFFCSAHVLLGFHRASVGMLKEIEGELKETGTLLGRDSVPGTWGHVRGTAAERVVFCAASVFGPVGHYLGLRDHWEAECSDRGIKSEITNYKDNRFNGLFEVSLQISHHRKDFLELIGQVDALQKQKKNKLNAKIRGVQSDLQCDNLMTLIQGLAIMFVHVTGPFWELVNAKNVNYLELYTFFQPLFYSLNTLADDPRPLMTEDLIVIPGYPPKVTPVAKSVLQVGLPGKEELLIKVLKSLCSGFVSTIKKQLIDFLPGGKYSSQPAEDELKRTAISHVTNIACEHHLGSLDSSQRRRPNASYHYHSSVELLKKTLPRVLKWLNELEPEKRTSLMKLAKTQGRILRMKHMIHHKKQHEIVKEEKLRAEEKRVAKTAKKIVNLARKRKKVQDGVKKTKKRRIELPGVRVEKFSHEMVGKYIGVVYNEPSLCWFPGIVSRIVDDKKAEVRFLHSQTPGINCFSWPAKDDVDIVESVHVFVDKVEVEPMGSGGRLWKLQNYTDVLKAFGSYSKKY